MAQQGSQSLRVRVRRTLAGDGGRRAVMTVHCPTKDRSIHITECRECERWQHVAFATEDGNPLVVCRPEAHASPAGEGSMPPIDAVPISSIMSRKPPVAGPEYGFEAVAGWMNDRRLSAVPVVDGDGKPIGMLSLTTLVREKHEQGRTQERVRRVGNQADPVRDVLGRSKVSEVMTPIALALPEDATVVQAAALMAFQNIHHLTVVGDDGTVVGTVTALALVSAVVEESEEKFPPPLDLRRRSATETTPVHHVMTEDVACVSADLDVDALMSLFLSRSISGAPVVDEEGRPIGVVSKHDIAVELYGGSDVMPGADPSTEVGFHVEPVREAVAGGLMTRNAITVPEGASLEDAARLLASEQVQRLPVVSDDDEVVGIISVLDVLSWVASRHGYVVPARERPKR